MRTAILLMAYGGPDSLEDIEPYLLDIRGGRPTSPEFVAEIRERYARIGGRSPLLEITRAQAGALEKRLNERSIHANEPGSYRVYVGMRHWKPYIREAVDQMAADSFDQGLALCMAPHASRMSSGAYQAKLNEALAALPQPVSLRFIDSWYEQPFLIQALANKVRQAARRFPAEAQARIDYLFTAHSLPAVLKEQGDPYFDQLQSTARLLARELGLTDAQWTFGYQSAGAAAGQWMGPAVEEMLPQFAARGQKDILVTPVGFMADHVEVLYDLDIEAQEIARAHGIRLVRSESLNASPDFIDGLARFILETLKTGAYAGR
jgi:protoporphyrin/coproporphyrin ferrochelatase